MKLKMVRGPRPGQKEMVCHTTVGTYSAEIGKTFEVSEKAGHEIMTKWSSCFTSVAEAPPASAVEPKVIKKYSNKSVSTDDTVVL